MQTPEEFAKEKYFSACSFGGNVHMSFYNNLIRDLKNRDAAVRAPLIETLEYVRPQLANMEKVFRDWGWEALSRDLGKSIAKVDAALETAKETKDGRSAMRAYVKE